MYYGIDLGTTTTLVAEPVIKGSTFDARAIKIRQLGKQGNRIEKEILPSYAYFPEGKDPVVFSNVHLVSHPAGIQTRRVDEVSVVEFAVLG